MMPRLSVIILLVTLGIQVVNGATTSGPTTANKTDAASANKTTATPASKATPAPTGTTPASAAAAQTFSEADIKRYLETLGFLVAQRSGLASLDLNDNEWKLILEGMKLKNSPVDAQEEWMKAQEYLLQRTQEKLAARIQEQTKSAQDYFAKLEKDKDVRKTDSGLFYKIKSAGSGDKPKGNEIVKINYTGKLLDGTVFNDTIKAGAPTEFALDEVIAGMSEGLKLVGKGGKIELYVPAKLAYGDQEPPGIPAGSALVFDVELLDIRPNATDIDLSKAIDFNPSTTSAQPAQTAAQPTATQPAATATPATATKQPAAAATATKATK